MEPLTPDLKSATERELLQEVEALRSKIVDIQAVEEKLVLRDAFISFVSHELRTPLTSIKGFSQLLQRNLKKRQTLEAQNTDPVVSNLLERDTRAINAILEQTDMMSKLIGEMLDFSRILTGRLELRYSEGVDITALVRRVVQTHHDSKPEHPFILKVEAEPLFIKADTLRLEQILDNLISNAAKYSPPDKPIIVGIEPIQKTANEIVIWVKDEGVGIGPEQQAQIFDAVYHVRSQQTSEADGLGLGLFISREIINKHGGRLWLESQLEVGSTFYFSLPL